MRACLFLFCGLLAGVVAWAAKPLAVFTAKDYLSAEWPRTLVTYRVALPAGPGNMRLVDENGQDVPVQVSAVTKARTGVTARVSFFAALPKDGSYRYTLVPGNSTVPSGVAVIRDARGLVLQNGKIAVRVPAEGKVAFPTPRPMESADTGSGTLAGVPGPVQGVQLLDGTVTAAAYFWAADPASAPMITGYTCRITEYGAVFVEAQVRYAFSNGGYYTLTARVVAGEAAVRLDEQCDLQTIRTVRDWRVVFPLTDDGGRFRPDKAWWCTSEGRLPGADAAFEDAAVQAGFPKLPANRVFLGSKTLPASTAKTKLIEMAVWYPWAPIAYYAGFVDGSKVAAPREKVPFAAVVPMHAGNWRGIPESSNGDVNGYPGGKVAMSWPLTVSPHPNTLLHTGEFDKALPYTTIRRQWAFLGGPMQYHDGLLGFRRYEGHVTLDDYKDWVLEWPQDPKVTYPRLVTDRAHVDAWKDRLDQHPMGETLKKLLYYTDDAARAKQLYTTMGSPYVWGGPRGQALDCILRDNDVWSGNRWCSSFRQAQEAAWSSSADELLASQNLTPEQRVQLRAWVAACCYALSEPDVNPRGAMVHLGNPNMPMNRFFALPFAAALIPDHPQAKVWMETARQYLRYKLAENTAPTGGWSELLTYYMAAASHTMQASMVLDRNGLLDDSTAALAAQAGSFPLALIAPRDPRFGARALPCWGHEGYWMIPTQWLPTAAFMRQRNPELAKALAWGWDQLGRPQEDHHDAGFSAQTIIHADLLGPEAEKAGLAKLASQWIPGFGAVMRAHAGDPNETFLSYRQGYMVSHCDANQGDYVLYSKGVPLTSVSLFQYAIFNGSTYQKLYESFGWHNRVRFGSQSNTGGWPGGGPISQVHRFSTSDSVDYLRGMGDYAPQRWTRQLLFLKGKKADGPNYFLLRDSFAPLGDGALEPKWWYLKTDGPTTRVSRTNTSLTYTSPWGPKLDVRFLAPATMTAESRQATSKGPLYNRAAMLWAKAGNKIEGSMVEETISITAAGPIPAGQDILVALYPQGKDEKLPDYTLLADGVAKIVTSESTDYVFLGTKPFTYTDANVRFSGITGAVRVYPNEVHLVIAEGPGEVSYGGAILRANVPATKVLPTAGLALNTAPILVQQQSSIDPGIQPKAAKAVTAVQPGVTRYDYADRTEWLFDAKEPLSFTQDGVHFTGRRGAVRVAKQTGEATLYMNDGERIAYGNLVAWGCEGPYKVTFGKDRITGETMGLSRFLYLTRPDGLDRLPTLVLDGQTYAMGTSGDFALGDIAKTGNPYDARMRGGILIVPVLPGTHQFVLRALDQPDIFYNWQAWPDGRGGK
jgi:hypothetical protein